jgi:SNF2 family DNA or RNA helicase
LKTPFFPHQATAYPQIIDMLKRDGYAGLFIDMGLGKTILTLYVFFHELLAKGEADHLIIVAPKTLLGTWRDEMSKHLDTFDVLTWKGCGPKALEVGMATFTKTPGKVFFVNVEAFQNKNEQLHSFMTKTMSSKRCLLAIDESSFCKSPTAARTKAVIKLAELATYRMILTGTEITKSCLDLYTQFKILKSDFWTPYTGFYPWRCRYAILETEYGAGCRTYQKVVGFQRQDELMAKIAPHVIRLKKDDVLDLPEKRFQEVWLDMPSVLRKVYDELKKELIAEYQGQELTVANAAVLFGRFRQLVGGHFPAGEAKQFETKDNLKLQFLLDELEDIDASEKVIVWASFREEIKLLHRNILNSVPLYGEMSIPQRDEAIASFRNSDGARVLVANPSVAAFGLNLQFCSLVYYYSLPLDAAQYWQSQDRTHRIGQNKSILYKELFYKDSVDARVKELLTAKTESREFFRNYKTAKELIEIF